jgi:hypothetical protein
MHRLAEVNVTDPDAPQLSRSAAFQVTPDQPLDPDESNPPFVTMLAARGIRHLQTLLVQLNVPDGQSETWPHCLHELLTQVGVLPEQPPQVYVPPQPSAAVPQVLLLHAVPIAILVQPQTLATPAPLHV